ncbi:MAG: prepilin-type N-terminal cleavage/methylation domain-containing protein [bacterium]|nr:prepilin-type N-terminal cleavage/methylation domain-containing protein [bacterium]
MQQKILQYKSPSQRSKVKGQRSRDGFTLLEVLIAIAISAVIVVIAGRFNGIIQSLGGLINYQLQAQQDMEIAFQGVVTDIRSMGPSSGGAYPIESAASNTLIFFSDVNRDGFADRVRYFFASSTFSRGLVAPLGTPPVYATSTEVITSLIPNVIASKSNFQYFNSSYTGSQAAMTSTVDVSPIRTVRVTVTADVSTSSAPFPLVVSEFITIRNLRSN